MFKAIASDLDGTLLNSKIELSEYSKEILNAANKKGIEFIISTGRMYRSLVRIIPQMPFCRYAVTTMGAEIYDTHKNERIYSVPLEPENARAVVEYGLKNNLHINIYINNVLYTNSLDKFSDFYLRTTDAPSTLIEGDVLEFIKDKVISKILYITEVEDAPAIQKECIQLFGDKMNVCGSLKMYTEFSSFNAQKDIAVNWLIEKLGIKKDELIVFGDSGNDVSMLKNTGYACAVANAGDYVKEIADEVVEDNDNDGVAKTVKRYILDAEQ